MPRQTSFGPAYRRRGPLTAIALVVSALVCLGAYIVATGGGPAAAGTNGPGPGGPPLYLGLDAYQHLGQLSYLEVGDRVEGVSTADPGGSNRTDTGIYGVAGGQQVLFDQTGPGIATFLRQQETTGAPWYLGVDGQPAQAVDPSGLGQASPAAFPYPLSLNTAQSQGSSIISAPIPFDSSIRWSSANPSGNFYGLYRKLPFGTSAPATTAEQANAVASTLRGSAGDLIPPGIPQQQGVFSLADGPTTVATLSGPSQIRALEFHVPYGDMVPFGNSRLQIFWDGETTPSVDAPVKFLVGDGAGVYQPAGRPLVAGWMAGAGGDGHSSMDFNLYWPMPFSHSARIVLLPAGGTGPVSWSVRYEPFTAPANWWGTFHATYSDVPNPVPGQDMNFLDVRGSGKLVGTVINFSQIGNTLEGDPHIYVDDSRTPQIAGTGTEEWGMGGNYWNGGRQVSLPLAGLPSSTNNTGDVDGAAFYRYLVADSIPFNSHLVVNWEHGGVDESTLPYRAAMLWYGNPATTAQRSDDLVPADPAGAAAHGYDAPGVSFYPRDTAYAYTVNSPLSAGTVAATTGTTAFTMAVSPGNSGTFLRRTYDACVANQRADVLVDGRPAGTWYNAGASTTTGMDGHSRCWADDDFPLPASLTAGKSSVRITLRFISTTSEPTTSPADTTWTASDYQLYSFVLSPAPPQGGGAAAGPGPAAGATVPRSGPTGVVNGCASP